jgi:hypothetical protein
MDFLERGCAAWIRQIKEAYLEMYGRDLDQNRYSPERGTATSSSGTS